MCLCKYIENGTTQTQLLLRNTRKSYVVFGTAPDGWGLEAWEDPLPCFRSRFTKSQMSLMRRLQLRFDFNSTVVRLRSLRSQRRSTSVWRDLQTTDVTSRWREDWQSATVVNSTLVVDPTVRLPGFDLHRRQWSLLNRFWTGQGHCNACRKKWGFTDNELCDWRNPDNVTHRQLLCIDQI